MGLISFGRSLGRGKFMARARARMMAINMGATLLEHGYALIPTVELETTYSVVSPSVLVTEDGEEVYYVDREEFEVTVGTQLFESETSAVSFLNDSLSVVFGGSGMIAPNAWVTDATGYMMEPGLFGSEVVDDLLGIFFPPLGIVEWIQDTVGDFANVASSNARSYNQLATRYNYLRGQLINGYNNVSDELAAALSGLTGLEIDPDQLLAITPESLPEVEQLDLDPNTEAPIIEINGEWSIASVDMHLSSWLSQLLGSIGMLGTLDTDTGLPIVSYINLGGDVYEIVYSESEGRIFFEDDTGQQHDVTMGPDGGAPSIVGVSDTSKLIAEEDSQKLNRS
jgi:hypothetical protein